MYRQYFCVWKINQIPHRKFTDLTSILTVYGDNTRGSEYSAMHHRDTVLSACSDRTAAHCGVWLQASKEYHTQKPHSQKCTSISTGIIRIYNVHLLKLIKGYIFKPDFKCQNLLCLLIHFVCTHQHFIVLQFLLPAINLFRRDQAIHTKNTQSILKSWPC